MTITPFRRHFNRKQVVRVPTGKNVTLETRGGRVLQGMSNIKAVRRAARSQTKTKRKLTQNVKHNDGPVSDSFVVIPHKGQFRIPYAMKMLTGINTYITNSVARVTWTVNTQAVSSILSRYNGSDLSTMLAQAASLIPTFATNTNYKVYMDHVIENTMITNQTNDVVKLLLYECIPRRDITSSTYSPANNAWTAGDTASSGGAATVNSPGSTPFQTPGFTKMWKVVKVTAINLHSGGHHVHRVHARPRHMVDIQTITAITNNNYAVLGKLSSQTLIVAHGYPTNDGTTTTNIGLAHGALDFVTTKSYRFRLLGPSESTLTKSTNLINPGTEAVVSDLTGAGTTIFTA